MNAAVSISESLFTNAVPASPPNVLLCECGEVFGPGDAVLHQNHYWNSSVKEWLLGDCFVECPECGHRDRLTAAVPKRLFLRVEQEWGR